MQRKVGTTGFTEHSGKYQGNYRGIVLDNDDPYKLGRIKIQIFPMFAGITDPAVLPWAIPAYPLFTGSGDGIGNFTVPEIDSIVYCWFEEGNFTQPIYFAEAPSAAAGLPLESLINYPHRKVWKTASGITHYLDDTALVMDWRFPSSMEIKYDDTAQLISFFLSKGAYYKLYEVLPLIPKHEFHSELRTLFTMTDQVVTVENSIFRQEKAGTTASASTVNLPSTGNFFTISGSTNITTINIKDGNVALGIAGATDNRAGTEITLTFTGTLNMVVGSGNLASANGSFFAFPGAVVTYIFDGTHWVEKSRNPSELSGAMKMWPSMTPPSGYLLCNGATINTTTYASLYAALGNSSTLPNFTNRFPYGASDGNAAGNASPGQFGGDGTLSGNDSAVNYTSGGVQNISSQLVDSGTSHTVWYQHDHMVMSPYLAEAFIIKA